jgi:hypothetical protein
LWFDASRAERLYLRAWRFPWEQAGDSRGKFDLDISRYRRTAHCAESRWHVMVAALAGGIAALVGLVGLNRRLQPDLQGVVNFEMTYLFQQMRQSIEPPFIGEFDDGNLVGRRCDRLCR